MRFATSLGIQHNGAPRPNTTNAEGHAAFDESLKQQVARIALTGVLADQYYGREAEQSAEFIPVVLRAAHECPDFLLKAARVSRKANFKLFPKLAVAALMGGKGWGKVADECVGLLKTYNTGQLLELALLMKGRKVGALGSRAQKALGRALQGWGEKKLEAETISSRSDLNRLVRLTHPNLGDHSVVRYVLTGEPVTDRQRAFEGLKESDQAKVIREHSLPFNSVKGVADAKKETWEAIRDGMSPIQVLLNLKALDARGVMNPQWLHERLQRVDLEKVRLVPHDVLRPLGMAYEMRKGYHEPLVHFLAKMACRPVRGLGDKRVGVSLDFSGSMAPGYAHNSLGNWVLAVTLANPIMAACPNRTLTFFGADAWTEGEKGFAYLKGCPPEAVFHNLLGHIPDHGTNVSAAINWHTNNQIILDVLFLFTDEQQNMDLGCKNAWNRYRNEVNPKATLVVVNVSNTRWHMAHEKDPSIKIIQSITPLVYDQFSDFNVSSVEMIERFA